jgi:hypothetical protein
MLMKELYEIIQLTKMMMIELYEVIAQLSKMLMTELCEFIPQVSTVKNCTNGY